MNALWLDLDEKGNMERALEQCRRPLGALLVMIDILWTVPTPHFGALPRFDRASKTSPFTALQQAQRHARLTLTSAKTIPTVSKLD